MDNVAIMEEMRANDGRAPSLGDPPLVIMHTIGAKTASLREVPIGYLPGEGDQKYVIASAGGSPRHPDWVHNLRAEPEIEVEHRNQRSTMRASELPEPERTERFEAMVAVFAVFAEYQEKAGERVIPVFVLDPVE